MNPNPQTPEELAAAVRGALESLKRRRPVFHSEPDFQHELGIELRSLGVQNIRMEYPLRVVFHRPDLRLKQGEVRGKQVDMWGDGFAIELKHMHGKFSAVVSEERFMSPRGTNVDDGELRSVWEDVKRIEDLVRHPESPIAYGLVVLLTNRADFWTHPTNSLTYGGNEVRCFPDKGGETVELHSSYAPKWEEWSNLREWPDTKVEMGGVLFRYAIVEVKR